MIKMLAVLSIASIAYAIYIAHRNIQKKSARHKGYEQRKLLKENLRIYHTEYPPARLDFFKWAEKFNVGTGTKNTPYEDKELLIRATKGN